MTRTFKILIGLAATLLMGFIWHGPLGRGAMFVAAIDTHARAIVAYADLPGVSVRLGHDPLSREAVLSGPADSFQRHGMKDEPGLVGRVATAEGVGSVHWDDEPRGLVLPLLAETLLQLALAYALGLGLGAILFGRRRRHSFLD